MSNSPLPERLRPAQLKDFIGQKHLAGKVGLIRKLLAPSVVKGEVGFPSLIFWGPPGTGKTTLARIIARSLNRPFYEFSAVSASSKQIEEVIHTHAVKGGQQRVEPAPVIFLDEIHRFNKAQQDKLLPHVERGDIVLIGATTENPSFEVIGALLSRTRVLVFHRHTEDELNEFIKRASRELKIKITKKAKAFLVEASNQDARQLLNIIEIAGQLNSSPTLGPEDIKEAAQKSVLSFDKQGEEYYNIISSYIKSMRASQPDAALYYLARMVEAGQDPLYIARRMVIFASEDVGMAQPTALVVANEVFRACETIGYPECAINLAHGTVYLAKANKDRSAYEAYKKAVADVKKYGNLPTPLKIRNAPTKLMKNLGYGKGYEMYDNSSLLPEKLKGKKYLKS